MNLAIALLLFVVVLLCIAVSVVYVVMKQRADAALHGEARKLMDEWRAKELVQVRQEISDAATKSSKLELETWKRESESSIRKDARQRSASTIKGKTVEHFVPWLPDFPYEPKDTRFHGAPVDYIVFKGLSDDEIEEIVFLEVKTGNSKLSKRQRQVRDAIKNGKVKWDELNVHPEDYASEAKDEIDLAEEESIDLLNQALTLAVHGDRDEAIRLLREAINIYAEPDVLHTLAKLLSESESEADRNEARVLRRQAKEVDVLHCSIPARLLVSEPEK